MKQKFYLLVLVCFIAGVAAAQNVGVGIATPNASAQLDISSTSRGLLIPRMTTAGITAISNPAKGLLVYDSSKNQLLVNMGTPAAPSWQTTVMGSGWALTGNSGTDPASQFIGSTDGKAVNFRVNNVAVGKLDTLSNIFWGLRSGQKNTTGYGNVTMGTDALKLNVNSIGQVAIGDSAMVNIPNGVQNTAVGYKALMGTLNDYGNYQNVAVGSYALTSNFSGYWNVALGTNSMRSNNDGSGNVGIGFNALYSNNAIDNVGMGLESLYSNTNGNFNTGVGAETLFANTTGSNNTALGGFTLHYNTTGANNTALGSNAMSNNTTGSFNVAAGYYALQSNSDSYNTAVGFDALSATTLSEYNTALGYNAGGNYDQGYNNVFLGANTGTNGAGYYNCIAIGQNVTCTGPSQVRIGNAATSLIGGYVGWSVFSDGRVKKEINENVKGLDFIMKLRPVTYKYDYDAFKRINGTAGTGKPVAYRDGSAENDNRRRSGFIAQEVEKASQESGYDFGGVVKPANDKDLYTLRYADFVVPLVKAVQELQAENEQLKKRLAALETKIGKP